MSRVRAFVPLPKLTEPLAIVVKGSVFVLFCRWVPFFQGSGVFFCLFLLRIPACCIYLPVCHSINKASLASDFSFSQLKFIRQTRQSFGVFLYVAYLRCGFIKPIGFKREVWNPGFVLFDKSVVAPCSGFIKLFRRYVGTTPGDYRGEYLSSKTYIPSQMPRLTSRGDLPVIFLKRREK